MNVGSFVACFRNELIKLFSRKRTYLGFVIFVVTELVILWLWHSPVLQIPLSEYLAKNGLEWNDYSGGLSIACFAVIFATGLAAGLYLSLVSGDLVAKEFEEGTIRMVLARPVSRLRVFVVKALAGATYTAVLMMFVGVSALIISMIGQGHIGNLWVIHPMEKIFVVYSAPEGCVRYVLAILLMALSYQTISAMALMCSCLKLRPATATVLTISVLSLDFGFYCIPYFAPYNQWLLSHHLSCWVLAFKYLPPWADIATSMLVLAGLTISFWVVGWASFSLRDIKN